MIWTIIQVAVGGALGAVSRYLAGFAFARFWPNDFAFATLFVNISGSLLIGVAYVWLGGLQGEPSRYAPLLITGFLGGYTTFSAFSLDFWVMFQQGRITESVVYAISSAVFTILAIFIGIGIAKQIS